MEDRVWVSRVLESSWIGSPPVLFLGSSGYGFAVIANGTAGIAPLEVSLCLTLSRSLDLSDLSLSISRSHSLVSLCVRLEEEERRRNEEGRSKK